MHYSPPNGWSARFIDLYFVVHALTRLSYRGKKWLECRMSGMFQICIQCRFGDKFGIQYDVIRRFQSRLRNRGFELRYTRHDIRTRIQQSFHLDRIGCLAGALGGHTLGARSGGARYKVLGVAAGICLAALGWTLLVLTR